MSLITWVLMLCALYGTYLNAKQDVKGFYYWIVSNVGFACINLSIGQYALTVLFGVYFLLAIKGINEWKNK